MGNAKAAIACQHSASNESVLVTAPNPTLRAIGDILTFRALIRAARMLACPAPGRDLNAAIARTVNLSGAMAQLLGADRPRG